MLKKSSSPKVSRMEETVCLAMVSLRPFMLPLTSTRITTSFGEVAAWMYHFLFLQSNAMTPCSSGFHLIPVVVTRDVTLTYIWSISYIQCRIEILLTYLGTAGKNPWHCQSTAILVTGPSQSYPQTLCSGPQTSKLHSQWQSLRNKMSTKMMTEQFSGFFLTLGSQPLEGSPGIQIHNSVIDKLFVQY